MLEKGVNVLIYSFILASTITAARFSKKFKKIMRAKSTIFYAFNQRRNLAKVHNICIYIALWPCFYTKHIQLFVRKFNKNSIKFRLYYLNYINFDIKRSELIKVVWCRIRIFFKVGSGFDFFPEGRILFNNTRIHNPINTISLPQFDLM